MDENLKKEIQEKYFQAKLLITEISKPNMNIPLSYFREIKEELQEIDDFFRHLQDA